MALVRAGNPFRHSFKLLEREVLSLEHDDESVIFRRHLQGTRAAIQLFRNAFAGVQEARLDAHEGLG